jgi:hypothetical protein
MAVAQDQVPLPYSWCGAKLMTVPFTGFVRWLEQSHHHPGARSIDRQFEFVGTFRAFEALNTWPA